MGRLLLFLNITFLNLKKSSIQSCKHKDALRMTLTFWMTNKNNGLWMSSYKSDIRLKLCSLKTLNVKSSIWKKTNRLRFFLIAFFFKKDFFHLFTFTYRWHASFNVLTFNKNVKKNVWLNSLINKSGKNEQKMYRWYKYLEKTNICKQKKKQVKAIHINKNVKDLSIIYSYLVIHL